MSQAARISKETPKRERRVDNGDCHPIFFHSAKKKE